MKRKLTILLISILGLCLRATAQADLLVTPTRVVFEGSKQNEEVNLVNIGKDTTVYSISFVQYKMKEDGSIVTIDKPDSMQMAADPFLRIFPRQVTLAPGEPQVIMIQYRRKPDMVAGEYRSHLYFRSEKDYKPLGSKKAIDSTLLSVQLIPVFGISIPVIIRSGTVSVNTVLSDIKPDVKQGMLQNLKLTINRKGNISTYGDIIVVFSPSQGKPYQIGALKGVGVYTNIDKRNIVVKINNLSENILKSGKVKVQYISNSESKRSVYGEGEFVIR